MLPILLDGLFGALAGLLAFLIARKLLPQAENARKRFLVFLVCTIVGLQVAQYFATPTVLNWQRGRELDEVFRTNPLYAKVLADHPEVRRPLKKTMLQAYWGGNRERERLAGQQLLAPFFMRYLANGTDEALAEFGKQMASTLKALQKRSPDACYYFQYPREGHMVAVRPEEGRNELQAAIEGVVLSAGSEVPGEKRGEGKRVFDQVVSRMRDGYKDKQELLGGNADSEESRAVRCQFGISLYEELLKLPQEQAGAAIRAIYGE